MTAASSDMPPSPHILRVAKLRQSGETPFSLAPDSGERALLAERLGAISVKKLRFDGTLEPKGKKGWQLFAKLGVTVVQPCSVTLEPVTTRIDTDVTRRFVPPNMLNQYDDGSETEMPEDDETEALGEDIDLAAILSEALSLALPPYPRKDGAELEQAQFAPEGAVPLDDDAIKPFASLAALRDKMQNGDPSD
ncbi:YceD family protein [Thalassococcus lentus]|uniref:DUF177 domain-containing protein n=1 Tax=Thalassococcus lentus TaxID=1210524 RepID=A0ABT4XQD6_9RHOB|nr:DUF177 domain-containing protein [Thalassococcus lentus]MDA7424163.1 DUF177 domain-containing protein [Thalassococcus lentus]